jgi:hypothetical protein
MRYASLAFSAGADEDVLPSDGQEIGSLLCFPIGTIGLWCAMLSLPEQLFQKN